MIYFTSDTHFCHSNVINLCERPFKSVHHMNNTLIHNWNAYVTKRDEIYILGDFLYRGTGQDANQILHRLNGKKFLIRGNHDKFLNDPEFDTSMFEWVKDYYEMDYQKQKIVMFHYPILEWQGYFRDSIHLYGHVHNASKDPEQLKRLSVLGSRAINVGVDVNNFFPVSINDILRKAQR
ncbi:3',5'-cyclic adenosine monophosphate phosphodiesterase CpdA [Xenorhabdus vietnamensis]|uniref:3',5'-cyclic adenosine monophosphate phosphodiesterase CpdA n=1 Tax=Xenorhabdus vietnamensis TaxID=351656 RepID=A0A1Y2SBZ9_9GAMM|nr:metallophosphoesterase [Xenorhabdus vietnamensis]OTA15751.1 3',5'-cyclic adenosine monophosphate phosphodiesterase CpdA [Xenorhabdus vietnamensis]